MTIDLIKSIISKGETRTLELKKSTGELKDAMHSLCAFLNTDGGVLVFGVAPCMSKCFDIEIPKPSDGTHSLPKTSPYPIWTKALSVTR